MVQESIALVRTFFITVFVVQIIFIIKKIHLILSKNDNVAYYMSVGYYPAVFLFTVSNFFYFGSEITGWRGYNGSPTFALVLYMVFDIISLILFIILARRLYEVHISYRPTKKKIPDIDKSFIIVYDFIGRKELIYLNRINASKSKLVTYKPTVFLELLGRGTYIHLVLDDNSERKINVGGYIQDPEIGLFNVRHMLKIPLSTIVKNKE